MNDHKDSYDDNYDIIVIGSGIGGLTPAALLAKAGKKVLVIEHHNRPGGCAQAFKRKKFIFDSSVHLISSCLNGKSDGDSIIGSLLNLLGVQDLCQFIRVDPFYTALFPGARFDIPLGIEEFIQALVQYFPKEEEGIRKIIQLSVDIARETRKFSVVLSPQDAIRLAMENSSILQYQAITLSQVMDEYLSDTRLKSLFSSLWGYFGVPPSRLSFFYFSVLLINYIEEGAFHCKGSFKNFTSAIVEALKKNGGKLLLNNKVSKIVIKNNQATGIMLENGEKIQAPLVISNSDAIQTFKDLVGFKYLPNHYVKNLIKMRLSGSAFIVYAATKQKLNELNAGHEMFYFASWDHEENYNAIFQDKIGVKSITIPTLSDPSLAPEGIQLVTMLMPVNPRINVSWHSEKERYTSLILNKMEEIFPGFQDQLIFVEGASPQTIERYTLNRFGSIYGWEISMEQMGNKRLDHQTPIKGLFLSGHWSQPGNGIYGVTLSGIQTAQIVLGYNKIQDLYSALQKQNI